MITCQFSELRVNGVDSVLQETRRNTLIKDGMREQCIPHLVESWFQILQTYQHSHPELTCQCLEVVGAFVSWIDLNLIANDRSVTSRTSFIKDYLKRFMFIDAQKHY